jgi:cell division protein FtsA
LPIGAKNVTNDLAIGLRLSLESAEKMKLNLSQKPKEIAMPEDKSEEDKEKENKDEIDLGQLGIYEDTKTVSRKTLTEGIIKPRLNEIFTMVGMEVKKSGFGGMTPSGLVLTGGGALTVGAVESAKRVMSMPVRLGVPTGVNGLTDDILTPAYASSLGLILYGAKNSDAGSQKMSLPGFGKISGKIPVGGLYKKAIDLIKSLLP